MGKRLPLEADEHGICDHYAAAICHEYELRRRLRLSGA